MSESPPPPPTPPPPPPPSPPQPATQRTPAPPNPYFPHGESPFVGPETPELARDREWQRLDPRMLLVHPARELLRFLPVLLVIFFAGSAGGGPPWHYVGVVFPIAFGVLRYLTTGFRIAEGRVELRHGLLSRHVLSTPSDRVRTVDLTSSPIHRLLGLTTVRIGTGSAGSDDVDLDLDGLPIDRARELRRELLRVTSSVEASAGASDDPSVVGESAVHPPLATFAYDWLRFAPFTGAGLIVAAAVFGAVSQLLNLTDSWERIDLASLPVPGEFAVLAVVVLLVVLVVPISVIGYLVTNWAFRLTRSDGSWHLSRGLLTTRETSLDEDRVAGISLSEGLAVRLAGGRALNAIVTGVDRKTPGSSSLVPPAPAGLVLDVAARVITSTGAIHGPLLEHGPAARRRRWVRAVVPTLVPVALALIAVLEGGYWWPLALTLLLLALMVLVAADRVRGLGHGLIDGYVVARSGSLARRRETLRVEDVIGWNLRATYFQRRVGLSTLLATTAGGRGAIAILDVPTDDAVGLADAARPGLISQFLAPGGLSRT